jgi:hypothetical protein
VVLLAFVSESAVAATAGEAIARLNAQRAENGIPAGIVERPDWSYKCARHNDYQRQNGLGHDEDPSRPGYSPEGAWAGQNSVLASGANWDGANPFENAPIHLDQLLAPRLAEMGIDDSAGYVCATTWPGMTRPAPAQATVYTYPGNGRTGVPYAQTASESPFVPGDFVGLPGGTTTGPNILVLADRPTIGPARITGASLTGPDGPVELRWVDNGTGGIGPYLVPGGVVIPVRPLRPASAYSASVTVSAEGATTSRAWSFTTAAAPRPPTSTPAGGAGSGSSGGYGSGSSDDGVDLPPTAGGAQWIQLTRRTVRAGRSFNVQYRAASRGKISVRLVARGRTYVQGGFPVAAGERGSLRVPTARAGRYTLTAKLRASRTTTSRWTVRVR